MDDEQALIGRPSCTDDEEELIGRRPADPPQSLPELVAVFSHRHTAAVNTAGHDDGSYYADLADGWLFAWTVASRAAGRAAQPGGNPHRLALEECHDLVSRLKVRIDRIMNGPNAPDGADGRFDALDEAATIAGHLRERLMDAEQAARASIPIATTPSSMWDGYPKAVGQTEMLGDIGALARFLGGDDTSFTGRLLRLIAKADPNNLNRLAAAYPQHVRAWLMWQAMAPIPADRLMMLLRITEDLGRLGR